MDIASLAFSIDSADARRAKTDLDAMKGSSSDAAEQAMRLTRSFIDGKDPLSVYRAELALMDQQMRQAGMGIDGLVDRLNRLTMTMTGLQGPTRELRQTVGQIEAASAAFSTTSGTMEAFVRTSRSIGLSSQEMTSSLQRIQMALQGVTEEGQRARQVLQNYGVSIEGRGSGDAAAVLREFTDRIRQYRMDPAMGGDMRAVLGQTSISTMAALRDPDFRSTAQRERELRQDAEAGRIADLRRGIVARTRQNELRASQDADLENEWGTWTENILPRVFTSQAARRRELEQRSRAPGAVPYSQYQNSREYLTDPMAWGGGSLPVNGIDPVAIAGGLVSGYRMSERGLRWLGSDEFDLQQAEITARYNEEQANNGWWGGITARGRAVGRRAASVAGRYETVTPPERLPVNERTEGYMQTTGRLAFTGNMSDAERSQRGRYIEAAGEFGIELTDPDNQTAEQIAARLSPQQRAALAQREGAYFGSMNAERSRGIAATERTSRLANEGVDFRTADLYGIRPTDGAGAGVSEQDAERSRRVAQVVVQAETTITDAYERGARIRMEVAEIERQIDDQRRSATSRNERQTADLREQTRIIERSLGVDGGGSQDAGAALRLRAAQRASEQTGGPTVESALNQGFEQELGGAQRQYLQARRQGESQSFQLGQLRAGASEISIADSERVFELTRGMREANEALGREIGTQSDKYRANRDLIGEMEIKLRAQLEVERQISQEINVQKLARQTADTGAATTRGAADATAGARTDRQQREAIARNLAGPGASDAQVQEVLRTRASEIDAAVTANRGAANEAQRFSRADALATARTGGTGNPVEDRRLQFEERLRQNAANYSNDPETAAANERQLRAQYDRETQSISRAPIVRSQQAVEQEAARAQAQVGISYTQRDLENFARTIATEAGGAQGRQAVGNVIINRARMNGQGLSDVVSAPGQFEVWQNGRARGVDLNSPDGQQAMALARRLLSGELGDITGGADHFYSPRAQAAAGRAAPGFANGRTPTAEIGGNSFYRIGGVPQSAYRAAYGVDGELAAGRVSYEQSGGTQGSAYTMQQAMELATRSLTEFTRSTAQANIALGEMEGQIGKTQYERGRDAAVAAVMPAAERDRSIAASLPAGDPRRALLNQQAQDRIDLAQRQYDGRIRLQGSDERQTLEDEIADQRFQANYWGSSTSMQRDLGMQQQRRRLTRSRPVGDPSIEGDVQQYGTLYELREQNRVMGMLRDSWYQIGNAAGSALERVITQGGKATDVLKAMLAEMATYYLRAGTRLAGEGVQNLAGQALGFVGKLLGGGGGAATGTQIYADAAAVGPFLPSAQGNVLGREHVYSAMAQGGGLYSHAQYVPMAGGGTALVGEAGPEAAVPLVRMPSGNLGVRSGGASGPAINNNFNVTVNGGGGGGGGGNGGNQRMGTEIARSLEGMVTSVLVRQIAPGGVLDAGGRPTMR